MTPKQYHEVRKNIENGTYKLVRLVQKKEGKELPEVVIPNNGIVSTKTGRGIVELALERLEYIRLKCKNNLPNGNYILECRISNSSRSIIETYDIEINREVVIINADDKTAEQVTQETDVHIDDYLKLMQENANLQVTIAQLQMEIAYLKENAAAVVRQQASSLGDSATEKTEFGGLAEILKEALPAAMNLADRHYEVQEKRLALEEKRINGGLIKKKKPISNTMNRVKQKTFEQLAQEEAHYMNTLPEDQFDPEMDLLQQEDPELYDRVCEILGIEEEEEPLEEEGEEEEEPLEDQGEEEQQ